jgi:hypothetical protein
MTIHELNNPLPVETPHGSGRALFIFDYSIDINSVWGIRLDQTGEFKHYYSDEIRIYGNPMSAEKTTIPNEWINKTSNSRWPKGSKMNMDFLDKIKTS